MGKSKLDLGDFEKETALNKFDIDEVTNENEVHKKETFNKPLVKGEVKNYASIFNNSLDDYKTEKVSAALYKVNADRINILSNLLSNKGKADILNYIIQSFFQEHKDEIEKDYKQYLAKIKTDPLKL